MPDIPEFEDNPNMLSRRLGHLIDDFEATVRIFGSDEGGRRTPAWNVMRWDWAYADTVTSDNLYCIYPDFLGPDGNSWPADRPLPIGEPLRTLFYIRNHELRETVLRGRIQTGTRFYCHEGGKRVAEGTVTELTGLAIL